MSDIHINWHTLSMNSYRGRRAAQEVKRNRKRKKMTRLDKAVAAIRKTAEQVRSGKIVLGRGSGKWMTNAPHCAVDHILVNMGSKKMDYSQLHFRDNSNVGVLYPQDIYEVNDEGYLDDGRRAYEDPDIMADFLHNTAFYLESLKGYVKE